MLWRPSLTGSWLRRGHVVVQIAFALIPIIGISALAIDGGMLFDNRRKLQAAADAAALAAATDLFTNYYANSGKDPKGTAATSARTTSAACGFTNGTNATVTVSIPPTTGTFIGVDGYVEVTIQYNQPRYFSAIWGSSKSTVSARAVARGTYLPGDIGILILSPTLMASLEIDGALTILNGGSVYVNSDGTVKNDSSLTGACYVGPGAEYNATGLYVVGSVNNDGGTINAKVTTGVKPLPDPLAKIPEPAAAVTSLGSKKFTSGQHISPGTYDSITISSGTVTMDPGIFIIKKGLSFGSGAKLTGDGVMIMNMSGDNVDFTNSAGVTLTPPTSGPYAGISWWEPRAETKEVHFKSSHNITMTGTMYAANGEFDFRCNGDAVEFRMGNYICFQMEANQKYDDTKNQSDGTVYLNPKTAAPTQRTISLVE